MEKFFTNKKNAVLISIFAMILWGSAIPLIKSTYAYLDISKTDTGSKILVAGIRFFMAGILSYVYYFFLKNKSKSEKIEKKLNFKLVIVFALLQTFLQYIFYYIGLSNTAGSKAAIIQASNAFFSVIIAIILIEEEHLSLKKVLALLIGTSGILIVNYNGLGGFSFKLTGEGFVILATLFGSLANVFLRKYGKDYNSFTLTASQFIVGSIPLIMIGFLSQKRPFVFDLNLFLFLLYGAFISATAFSLWTLVLKYNEASEFSIYKLFIPVFGTLFSIVFLNDPLSVKIILGLFLVLLASLILNRK